MQMPPTPTPKCGFLLSILLCHYPIALWRIRRTVWRTRWNLLYSSVSSRAGIGVLTHAFTIKVPNLCFVLFLIPNFHYCSYTQKKSKSLLYLDCKEDELLQWNRWQGNCLSCKRMVLRIYFRILYSVDIATAAVAFGKAEELQSS